MIKVSLYNRQGQKLTEINIKETATDVDGIIWGTKLFILKPETNQYTEANVVPAIMEG